MKIDEIKTGAITPPIRVDEAVNIQPVDKGEHFIGMQPGTPKHQRMKAVLDWTKESDPALYNKIMNLD